MFRSATTRQAELAEHRYDAYMDHWTRTADQWFDGTVESIENRLASTDRVIAFARDVVARLGSTSAGFLCVNALPNLEQSRRELAAARASLLTGFSDRQAGGSALAGRRTAKRDDDDDDNICDAKGCTNKLDDGEGYDGYCGEHADKREREGHYGSRVQRAIILGSRDFLAEQNTDDRGELLVRARRYAADQTSTLPASQARTIAAAFVRKVEELINRRPRTRQAAAPVTRYEDFDDQLMY